MSAVASPSDSRPSASRDGNAREIQGNTEPSANAKKQTVDSSKRLKCGCSQDKGRNLVVCIDGTSNQFGDKNTNVIELYSLIEHGKGSNQVTYYNSGIGTFVPKRRFSYKRVKQWLDNTIDLAIAWNFEDILLDAYRWLSENYEPGDRIFLFGFSRGAYQVRALSGMIEKIGLIRKGNEKQIPFAYQLYADPGTDKAGEVRPAGGDNLSKISKAKRFKLTFGYEDVKVHFVGAWDTVSSVGVVRDKSLPYVTQGMGHVCYFRHALALDERRVKFLPEYAYGWYSKPGDQQVGGSDKSANSVKEVWFAGSHGDIGGGNVENPDLDQSRPSLRWMYFEAKTAGLRLREFNRKVETEKRLDLNPSLKGIWYMMEIFPFKRLLYGDKGQLALSRRKSILSAQGKDQEGKTPDSPNKNSLQEPTTCRPHKGSGRNILPGQLVHSSAIRAIKEPQPGDPPYKPSAKFPSPSWDDLCGVMENAFRAPKEAVQWLEFDPYDILPKIPSDIPNQQEKTSLLAKLNSPEGLWALWQRLGDDDFATPQNLELLLSLFKDETPVYQPPRNFLPPLLSKSSRADGKNREIFERFLDRFTTSTIIIRTEYALSVAFSPDGKRIASGFRDGTIRVWDAQTGELAMPPLEGHTNWVFSVAFSPDGTRIASGSYDSTIRVWDAKTGELAMPPLEGHTDWVNSVVFSPDGMRIASGSDDKTIQVWDAQTGELAMPPLEGHTDYVRSVAFSPDGTHIASGSFYRTIRVWDAKTGELAMLPLEGHTGWVSSVAFSPDGTRIASGSFDRTIRVWDAKTGEPAMPPLEGHSDWVFSVAFSPDGTCIASGSDDRTIRVWDAKTGAPAMPPLEGHEGSVWSVAFSPDGTRFASSSSDKTIRIWDVEREGDARGSG